MTDVSDGEVSARMTQKMPVTMAAQPYSENGPNFHTGHEGKRIEGRIQRQTDADECGHVEEERIGDAHIAHET